ncbi:adenosine kinase b [Perkinsela sp. CCAP 1560/4]|nr:adenosine kinase b [Perkinsela sp. CCAP 1560/4]|eukprot:KNH01752.1 adenosine kinase b [Perkinsela sp. CCAP 1560/4]
MSDSKKVLVFCNPLLDISSNVSADFMAKYQLQPGNAILADEKLHNEDFFKDLQNQASVEYLPGGSGMNTARVCSWIKQINNDVSYMGCVGKDEYADKLTSQASKDGVNVDGMLVVQDGTSTGLCGVCITNKERSLVAALGAANKFTHEHLSKPAVQNLLNDAQIIYITGFCLTVSPQSVFEFAEHALSNNKIVAMNVSAPFIAQFFTEPLLKLVGLSDIILCNETEAKALAQALAINGEMPLEEIAMHVLDKMEKQGGKRIVVFTSGADPTIVATDGKVTSYPVKAVSPDSIIDVNGAGDAFVGGFLAMYSQGKSIEQCVTTGHYAAGVIIQHSGCQFPSTPSLE